MGVSPGDLTLTLPPLLNLTLTRYVGWCFGSFGRCQFPGWAGLAQPCRSFTHPPGYEPLRASWHVISKHSNVSTLELNFHVGLFQARCLLRWCWWWSSDPDGWRNGVGILYSLSTFWHVARQVQLWLSVSRSESSVRCYPFHSQVWSSSNFSCSLTSNITSPTIWRTWLFIAYADERWLYYQFSLLHLYVSL